MKNSFPFARILMGIITLLALYLPLGFAHAANDDCTRQYTVQPGDTLGAIATKFYDNPQKYSIIFYANEALFPDGPSSMKVGLALRIPCAMENVVAKSDAPAAPAAVTPVAVAKDELLSEVLEIQLLTARDYAPFTDPSLPNGGMITELLDNALERADVKHNVNWINFWGAHLDPLLTERKYDMGFPWTRPLPSTCPNDEDKRCNFLFSDSLFQVLRVLFVNKDNPISFDTDSELEGRSLCRPEGYYLHDLDQDGRNWLKEKKITLLQPVSVRECFELLVAGKVDAVAINDFTGREAIAKAGIHDQVVALNRELSIESLHVLIHKTHPKATIMLNMVNKGLAALKKSGTYDKIMEKHLFNHWSMVEAKK